ncbi:MAG: MBL fold metallo-hydrolase [Aquabacterium sp.]
MPPLTDRLDPLDGLTVLERGWLSSNNILIHAAPGEAGATLVDTGHVAHAEQTVALVHQALAGQPLAAIVNTHLHSDHCGGNAALAAAYGLAALVPATLVDAVVRWDRHAMSHEGDGDDCPRFDCAGGLAAGGVLSAGGRQWQVLAAQGHDPHALMLFDAHRGVLLSADALWENGFGVVFPELVGEPGFADTAATLDLIATLPVAVVVPGHGAPFTDVAGALRRARARLAGMRADPVRHGRHAAKVFIKYRMMQLRRQDLQQVLDWASASDGIGGRWPRFGQAEAGSPQAWVRLLVDELVTSGALAQDAAGGLRDA